MTMPAKPNAWTPASYISTVDYLERYFYGWTEAADFLRMVIIECYAGTDRCIALVMEELQIYVDAVSDVLSVACGPVEARQRATSLGHSLIGLLWQAVMKDGNEFRESLSSAAGHDRVRNIIRLLLPLPDTKMEVA